MSVFSLVACTTLGETERGTSLHPGSCAETGKNTMLEITQWLRMRPWASHQCILGSGFLSDGSPLAGFSGSFQFLLV